MPLKTPLVSLFARPWKGIGFQNLALARPPASAASQYVYMGTFGIVKHSGKEDFVRIKRSAADRAFSLSRPAS